MKKVLLWCIPTLLIVFFLSIEQFFDAYISDALLLMFFVFTLFFAPCYYVVLSCYTAHNKIKIAKSFLYSISFILVNSVLICPESLQVYLGLRKWEVHDIDMFPLFTILPTLIIIFGFGIMILARKSSSD